MRDTLKCLWIAGATAMLLASPARAMTVDEVITRHIEARGGAERWQAIQTLRITGTMTSWSRKAPFTMHRKRDDKYHLDSTQNDKKIEIGYDGQTAWWDNHFMQEGAQRIRDADLAVLLREIDFPSPFFDHKQKGYEVRLLGPTQFEGQPAIGIEVKRGDGLAETWYLDPATYLEIARESPGADFGRPVPQRTYYDDFRSVAGVKMPFRVESQWYTRERILSVDKIEANVEIDEARFRMPPPAGMEPLLPLAGAWKVAVSRRDGPGAPWQEGERTSHIEALLGGGLLQERFATGKGNEVVRSITFDRFKKLYRITEINDSSTYLDVAEGDFDEQKRLVASNLQTGTTSKAFGFTIHGRLTISEITPEGFKTEEEYSIDGGKEWFLSVKSAYTRPKD